MKNRDELASTPVNGGALERIAQSILLAHAWVSGPAMTEKERIQRELVRAEAAGNTGSGITG